MCGVCRRWQRNWGELPCCVYTNACLHGACCKCCVDKESENLKVSGRTVENFFNGPFSNIFIYSNARCNAQHRLV